MDESAKSIAYHFELPLHFRNNRRLPNNRHQPLQRLKRRKSKLKRNPNFFGNYKQLMDTLLNKVKQKYLVNLLLRTSAGIFHIKESKASIGLTKL